MPLIQSSKPCHFCFCQKLRVNKTECKLNEIKLQKNCKKLFVYLKYRIKGIAAKTQPGVSIRRWGGISKRVTTIMLREGLNKTIQFLPEKYFVAGLQTRSMFI